eukprot:scaffold1916_cov294-Prasinococcus_capsulatus_cf.AAC.2
MGTDSCRASAGGSSMNAMGVTLGTMSHAFAISTSQMTAARTWVLRARMGPSVVDPGDPGQRKRDRFVSTVDKSNAMMATLRVPAAHGRAVASACARQRIRVLVVSTSGRLRHNKVLLVALEHARCSWPLA